MARQLRIQFPGACYHVMHRGAGRQDVYAGDPDYLSFLHLVGQCHERYGLEVFAYCLMTNHYHLVVRTPEGNLAAAMRHLNSSYTQRFNRRHSTDGPLFRGRYMSRLIEEDDYLQNAIRYVHRNPIEAGLESEVGIYRWNSARHHMGISRGPKWLSRQFVGAVFDSSQSYAEFIRKPETEYEIGPSVNQIDGSREYVDSAINGVTPDTETRHSHRLCQGLPALADIDQAVAEHFGVATTTLHAPSPGRRNLARIAALVVANSLTVQTYTDLAEWYGYQSKSGVAAALRRAKEICNSTNFGTKCDAVKAAVLANLHPLET